MDPSTGSTLTPTTDTRFSVENAARRVAACRGYALLVAGYRDLLRTPGVARMIAAQLVARLPSGMMSLAILLHVEQRTRRVVTLPTSIRATNPRP